MATRAKSLMFSESRDALIIASNCRWLSPDPPGASGGVSVA